MPMRGLSVVEQREAFVSLATTIGANRSGLCRDFGISRKTGLPNEALGLQPPARRYRPSPRVFCESLPPIEYGPGDLVRKVDGDGWISFRNRPIRIGKAFRRQPVALRPGGDDGVFDIHYCVQRIGRIDLRALDAPARGFVEIARAMPTTPQAPQQHQVRNAF